MPKQSWSDIEIIFKLIADNLGPILYLGGIAVIELLIRPLFTAGGTHVPITAEFVMIFMEIISIVGLGRSFLKELFGFISDFLVGLTKLVKDFQKLVSTARDISSKDYDDQQSQKSEKDRVEKQLREPDHTSPSTSEDVLGNAHLSEDESPKRQAKDS